MTKNDKRELESAIVYAKLGSPDVAARSLSAMYRAARNDADRHAIADCAAICQVTKHAEYII